MTGPGRPGRTRRWTALPVRTVASALRRRRLMAGIAVGLSAYVLAPEGVAATTRLLMAWDSGAGLYLVAAAMMMARSDVGLMRRRAAQQDEGDLVILLLTISAAVVSLVAIAAELKGIQATTPETQGLRIGLSAVTILVSWFFLHVIMALHYAHDHYSTRTGGRLVFPEKPAEPGYGDFLYFAFNIGAAGQTSDVTITSPHIRRVVLGHTILSFLFNTTILALAVNVGASLL